MSEDVQQNPVETISPADRPPLGDAWASLSPGQTSSWLTEYHFAPEQPEQRLLAYGYAVQQRLCSRRSAFQQIDVIDNPVWGRCLVIDGFMMTTEADEPCYHEMLAHVPLLMIERPRRVLIIGGGDGGLAREVLRHASVEHIDLVEIDRAVVDVAREFLPSMAGSFDDPRLHCHFVDGVAFVAGSDARYDAILIDSTDPIGPGRVLFEPGFYRNCQNLLREGGLLAAQGLSPWLQKAEQEQMFAALRSVFTHVRPYLSTVPTYPGAQWVFALAGDCTLATAPRDPADADAIAEGSRYYNRDIHGAAFCLPNLIRERLLT